MTGIKVREVFRMGDLLKLEGKNIVIMGVANERSLAWGVAKQLYETGANLIFTNRQERSRTKLERALDKEGYEARMIVQCDVNDDESIKEAFAAIGKEVGTIHGIVHSVAFAKAEDLKGDFVETSRDGYAFAQDTSAYSLVAVAREAKAYMSEGGAIVTMTYLGAERVLNGYNVMGVAKAALEASVRYLSNDLGKDGIRVNAISAGAIRTLAAKGVPSFNTIMHQIEETAPLKRNVDQREVGDMTVALLSNMGTGVTGEVIYVDGGYHIMG